MATIRFVAGEQKGITKDIDKDSIIIGRGENTDLQVEDEGVSRKHAEIFRIGNACFVKDLESTNSTFLNDREVTKEELLQPGDEIQVGTTKLVYHKERESDEDNQINFQENQSLSDDTVEFSFQDRKNESEFSSVGEKQESKQLKALYEVGRIVGDEQNQETLLQKVLECSIDLTNAGSGYTFLLDEKSGKLLPAGDYQGASAEDTPPVSRTIIQRVLRTSRSVLTSDAASDQRFSPSTSVMVRDIESVICVPIIARGEVIGIIYLHKSGSQATFEEEDLKLLTSIAFQTGVALSRIQAEQQLRETTTDAVGMIVRGIEAADPDTRGHSQRVASLATSIGQNMKLANEQLRTLQRAALLHDIGKIVELDSRLSPQDVDHPEKLHIEKGVQLIEESGVFQDLLPGIKYHHIRMDGSGIPEGKTGENLPTWVHILIVANKFDNLLHNSSEYQEMISIKEAVQKLEEMSNEDKFHSDVTSALVDLHAEGKLFSTHDPFQSSE